MKVCIVGSGVSGLVAARHCLKNGFEISVLEARNDIGGTWLYSERVGFDEYGYKIYSNMYPGLRTNLPKEVMSFPDFQYQPNQRSFLTGEEVFEYIKNYAEHFNIIPHIKFNHLVEEIKPQETSKMAVKYVNKATKIKTTEVFDAVMICTGVYNDPIIPEIPGIEYFKGITMHSNLYRTPETFKDKKLLVIGAGPSAKDVVYHSYQLTKHVVLSHHNKLFTNYQNTPNITIKNNVDKVLENGEVLFVDGTTFEADYIVYCTGYRKKYDFISPQCGITVKDYEVYPLYKHMISIDYPSLCIIGLPNETTAFRMIDLQSRFYMKYLIGEMTLPSKADMIKDAEVIANRRETTEKRPFPKSTLGFFEYQEEYYRELSEAANIESIPPVIVKMWLDCVKGIFGDVFNYRNYNYTALDDENFVKTHMDECK